MELLFVLFVVAFALNVRASFKLGLDWKGMLTTVRLCVREAYARLHELPTEESLERESRAPVFLHLVPAYQEPDIATTVSALVASRYPHGRLHVVVVTKEEEERAPHPGMSASTGELVRRLRDGLPPYQQKRLTHLVMPGPGRKAHQLNWALRPEALDEVLGQDIDPDVLRRRQRRGFAAGSRHVSLHRSPGVDGAGRARLSGHHAVARQLRSPADSRQDLRGPAVVHLHPCVARTAHQRGQALAPFARFAARVPRLGPPRAPDFELFFRRCPDLPRPQPVRAAGHTRVASAGSRPRARPKIPRSGYALGARGVLIEAMPMVELTDFAGDLREGGSTERAMVSRRARRYPVPLGRVAAGIVRVQPGAAVRHVGNKVVEWPIAALVYPVVGYLGWYLAYTFRWKHPWFFYAAVAAPTLSLTLTVWVGGIMTQSLHRGSPSVSAPPRRSSTEELQGEVPRHVPLPDVLAPCDARAPGACCGRRDAGPLRAGQDGSRRARQRHRVLRPRALCSRAPHPGPSKVSAPLRVVSSPLWGRR